MGSQDSWVGGPATIRGFSFWSDQISCRASLKTDLFLTSEHGAGCQDIQANCSLPLHATEMVQCPRSSGTTRRAKRYKPFTALTLLRPGVVFAKGVVFGCVGVQEPQRVLRNVFGCHHFVIADDIGESYSRELLLGVGFYRVELELCRGEKQQLLKAGFNVFFWKGPEKLQPLPQIQSSHEHNCSVG